MCGLDQLYDWRLGESDDSHLYTGEPQTQQLVNAKIQKAQQPWCDAKAWETSGSLLESTQRG